MRVLLALGFLFLSLGTHAVEYRFYSAAGVKAPLTDLSEIFNRNQPGYRIVNDFDTAGAAEKKFFEDANSTCLITTKVRMDSAIKAGTLPINSATPLADTLAGIASSNTVKPVIKNSQQLTDALLQAKSIAFSDPERGATVGRHFQQVIKKLGIEDQVLKKSILASDGVETMKLVLAKKVEIGITQMSEVIQADRGALVGPFPPEYELATRYSLYCKNRDQDSLSSFIGLLQSPFGNQLFRNSGLRPVQ